MNLLGVATYNTKVSVHGFGQQTHSLREKALITIESRLSSYRKTLPVLVTNTITGCTPSEDVNTNDWKLTDVNLADPEFHLSLPVDLLLGASTVFDIIRNGNKKIGEDLPHLQNTALGWVIGGRWYYVYES